MRFGINRMQCRKALLFALVHVLVAIGAAASAAAPRPVKDTATIEPAPLSYTEKSFQSWTPSAPFYGGTLVCNIEASGETATPTDFLVVRGVESPGKPAGPVQSYQARLTYLFDVEFSPGNRYLAMKHGELFEDSGHRVYLWDFKNKSNEVVQAPSERVYSTVLRWSPDNRYFLFTTGNRYRTSGLDSDIAYTLMLYDVRTGRSRVLALPDAQGGLTWTSKNTLLYIGRTPTPKKDKKQSGAGLFPERGSIYEMPIAGGKPKLLVNNVHALIAESPDGRWIAFQGWADASDQKWPNGQPANQDTIDEPGLYLYNRSEKKRYFLATSPQSAHGLWDGIGNLTSLFWTPDSKHLVASRNAYFYAIDMGTRKYRQFASLSEPEAERSYQPVFTLQYRPIGFSADNKSVIVENVASRDMTKVQAIDLETGAISTLAEIKGAQGVAWINGPA